MDHLEVLNTCVALSISYKPFQYRDLFFFVENVFLCQNHLPFAFLFQYAKNVVKHTPSVNEMERVEVFIAFIVKIYIRVLNLYDNNNCSTNFRMFFG